MQTHLRKLGLLFGMLMTFAGAPKALSVRFSVPSGLEGQLVFQNLAQEPIEVYQKLPIDLSDGSFNGVWETSFLVKGQGSLFKDINKMVQPLQFDSHSLNLKVFYRGPQGFLQEIVPGSATQFQSVTRAQGLSTIHLTNFSSLPQTVQIKTKSLTGRPGPRFTVNLEKYSSQFLDLKLPSNMNLEIQGEFPFGGYLKSAGGTQFLTGVVRKFQKSDQAGRLFLLANEARTQSYTVRLTDEKLISAAREQILNPTGWRARILVGEVSLGHHRDNQNLLSRFQPMWSWHISKVLRFSELASQSCDGSPQFLEDVLPAWTGGAFNGGSTVTCFWGYRIVQEL